VSRWMGRERALGLLTFGNLFIKSFHWRRRNGGVVHVHNGTVKIASSKRDMDAAANSSKNVHAIGPGINVVDMPGIVWT
jgi:hypothetical protein